jgi:hypothetical protein
MTDIDPPVRRTATDRRPHVRFTREFWLQPGKFAHLTDPLERAGAQTLLATCVALTDEQGGDGHVVLEEALAITGLPEEYAKVLILDQVVHQADHGCLRCPQPRTGHVYVHDLLEHNPSAEERRRRTELARRHGNAGAASRWAGHTPAVKEKKAVGRPRKERPETEMHPAEARALTANGKRRGRPPAPPKVYEPIVHQLCEELAELVRKNGFSVGTIGVDSWLKPCEQLLRIGPPNAEEAAGSGPVTPDQIRTAMRWFNNDSFWYDKIRTMKKLRDRYEELRSLAKNPNRPKRGVAAVTGRRAAAAPAAVTVPNMNSLYGVRPGMGQPGGTK